MVQILFNLALAYYYDNDVEEAEQVLMEAFHNTEDYDPYRKHIMCAIETLKVGSSHRGKYSQSTNANSDILYVLSMIYAKQLSLCFF